MGADEIKDSLPDLHSATVIDNELFNDEKSIDYTRGLDEYATAQDIITFLSGDTKPRHIYTKDLNVGGIAIADSMEKYLENDATGSGTLKAALKTPMHYLFSKGDDKIALEKLQKEKKHFNLGDFLHEAMLEPTKFSRALVEPEYSLASTAGIETGIKFWENTIKYGGGGLNESGDEIPYELVFALADEEVVAKDLERGVLKGNKAYLAALKSYSGKYAVTEENFIKIAAMKKHYDNYGGGVLKRLLTHSKREISMYCTDPESGRKLKIRPDALQFKENIGVNAIISIKSTATTDLRAFYNFCAAYHYDLSEGMYQEIASQVSGRDFNCTIMIMCQTVAPFGVAILVWHPHDIEMGKHKFRVGLQTANEADAAELYPGFDAFAEAGTYGLIQMALPQWNNREMLPLQLDN